MTFFLVVPLLLAFVVASVSAWLLSTAKLSFIPQDVPNHRSLHEVPVPRVGGVAILLGLSVSLVLYWLLLPTSSSLMWMLLGLVPLALIGAMDDWKGVSALSRFLLQFVSALILVLVLQSTGSIDLDGILRLVTAVLIVVGSVWAINAYNFMDGMDGFAGSMAVVGFSVFSIFGWLSGAESFFVLSAVSGASAAGFLIFNWPKASIFLGDLGSTSLGFLSVALGSWGVLFDYFPVWVPFLVFSPFWIDATVTLCKRALRGEKVWQAHREHYYQRLVLMGWGHRKTLIAEIGLMLACSLSAILGTFLGAIGQIVVVAGWILVYVIILTGFPLLEKHHSSL